MLRQASSPDYAKNDKFNYLITVVHINSILCNFFGNKRVHTHRKEYQIGI